MITSSKNDKDNYKNFTLENGLRVLTIQSPQRKAAVSMAINAGNYQDPDDCLGLAHFLEHMLFLGTETYPNESDGFTQFIEKRGGKSNAWTSLEYTNFFYDIHADFLADSLARFSRFFVCPLFSNTWIDKEINSIDAEFKLKIRDDIRRLHEVHKETSNLQHPFSRFTVGNKDTLQNSQQSPLQTKLFDYFENHYFAQNMCLVISGKESCDELFELAKQYFSDIPTKNIQHKPRPELPKSLYTSENLGIKIQVQTLKTVNRAIFGFPLPSEKDNYLAKSLTYLSCLFGHEGKGSLLSGLRQLGYATAVSAGGGIDNGHSQDFNISIQLTEFGLDSIEQVCKEVFGYINFVREQPFLPYIYDEKKQLAELAFHHQEVSKPIDQVSQLALKMHHYKIDDLLSGDYAMTGVDHEWLKQAFQAFSPDNLRLALLTKEGHFDQLSTWYQVPYLVTKLNEQTKQDWRTAKVQYNYQLPTENSYLPRRINAQTCESFDDKPQKIIAENGAIVWFKQEQKFKIPHGHIYISLDLPNSQGNRKKMAMTRLFIELLMDDIAEENYPAEAAGLHYQISPHQGGMTIHISGYAEKQANFAETLLKQLSLRRFTAQSFNIIKQKTLSSWYNNNHIKPANLLFNQLTYIIQNNQHAYPDLAHSVNELEFSEFAEFSVHLFDRVNLEAFIVGDWTMTQAIPLAEKIKHIVFNRGKPCAEVVRRVYRLPVGQKKYYMQTPHSDVSVVNYFQAEQINEQQIAYFMLLTELLSPICFQVLRSQKQLGYMVGCAYFPINRCPGMVVYVQSSSHSINHIQQEIDQVLNDLPEYLNQLGEKNWHNIKQALIYHLTEKETSLRSSAQNYWMSIGLKDAKFRRQQYICNWIEEMTLEDILMFMRGVFNLNQSNQRNRLILTAGPDCSEVLLNDSIDALSSNQIIRIFQNEANTIELNKNAS